jgi:serine/threonine-protein kinase RsbT
VITVNRGIEGGEYGSAGAATRLLKDQLRMAGVPVDAMRRAMIASYEAEMNVVIHARRGTLWARIDGTQLDLEVIDEGPGIPDIALAMREGWSTASEEARRMGFGAGMGLPNIRRSSDRFEIDSRVGLGTRVRSTILFPVRPGESPPREDPDASSPAPVIRTDRCRACHACLAACPTAALRLHGAVPRLLASRCIGCTECAAACPDEVFVVERADALPLSDTASVLVVPRAFLASFAAAPAEVLSALQRIGFAEIRFTEEWEEALRREALELIDRGDGPLVLPSCPAVAGLVGARFPGLLDRVAPFAPPPAAAATGFPLHRIVLVAACPAQRDAAWRESRAGRIAIAAPRDLAAAVKPLLGGAAADRAAGAAGVAVPAAVDALPAAGPAPREAGVLRVTGLRHVVRVLELAEAGALAGVQIIEPFVCDGGCAGSPYLGVDPFVADHRLSFAGNAVAAGGPSVAAAVGRSIPAAGSTTVPAAVVRRPAPSPRTGARLHPDMATAIAMLGAIDEAARSLPGRDCGFCGAPTCVAFAEDLVLGRAGASDCPHRTRPLDGAAAPRSVGAVARPGGDRTDRSRDASTP